MSKFHVTGKLVPIDCENTQSYIKDMLDMFLQARKDYKQTAAFTDSNEEIKVIIGGEKC